MFLSWSWDLSFKFEYCLGLLFCWVLDFVYYGSLAFGLLDFFSLICFPLVFHYLLHLDTSPDTCVSFVCCVSMLCFLVVPFLCCYPCFPLTCLLSVGLLAIKYSHLWPLVSVEIKDTDYDISHPGSCIWVLIIPYSISITYPGNTATTSEKNKCLLFTSFLVNWCCWQLTLCV